MPATIDLAEGRRLLNVSIIEWDNWVLLNAEAMLTLLERAREVLEIYTDREHWPVIDYLGELQDLYHALTATDDEVKAA